MMNFCRTDLEENEFEFCWKITKFSVHLKCARAKERRTTLKSRSFAVGIKDQTIWHLKLQIGGNDETGCKDLIGVSLTCESVKNKKEILASFRISTDDEREKVEWSSIVINKFNSTSSNWGFKEFMKMKDVKESSELYLPNDELTIYCEIKVIGSTTTHIEDFHVVKKAKTELSTDFERLFESGKFTDFTFIINEKKIKAHKSILSARSPVFAEMFAHEIIDGENVENIRDVSPEVFVKMLRYIYTQNVSDIDGIALDLLEAANKYELMGLVEICEELLCKTITVDNAVLNLIIADRYKARKLLGYIYNFIHEHKADVMATSEYKMMVEEFPQISIDLLHRLVGGSKTILNKE